MVSTSKKNYLIGARGSLLSVTQSELIQRQLKELTGDDFEIIKIKTEGDIKVDQPLWQMEGKDFFTKELDHALVKGQVDLVIHSYKDLGSVRPQGIELAAITERNYPFDIMLIKQSTIESMKNQTRNAFVIGTSSPRRIVNLEKHIHQYIPHLSHHTHISCKMLRGNVNTRIEKLLDNQYDAIVLAMAGLERLATHPDALTKLKDLVTGLNFMILPASAFPPAASQGALALEIASNRTDHGELKNKLKKVHHAKTAELIGIERERFQSYGGGCHLAVGIHAREIHQQIYVTERGEVDHQNIDEHYKYQACSPIKLSSKDIRFLGINKTQHPKENTLIDQATSYRLKNQLPAISQAHLFVTSSHCIAALKQISNIKTIWCAGTKSFKKIVQAGFWVNGCSDSLGHQELIWLAKSKLLALMSGIETKNIAVLTGEESPSPFQHVYQVYDREYKKLNEHDLKLLQSCELYYWISPKQIEHYFTLYKAWINPNAIHCSGAGKTYDALSKMNLAKTQLLSMQEFKKL
jgi:hydroxymethylbilane synthase